MNTLLLRLGLALAIGLLVGLERGWREREAPMHSRTAGIRTFALSGLLGGLAAAVSMALGNPWQMVAVLLAFAAVLFAFKLREAMHDGDFSATSTVAGLCVFMLGALAVAGDTEAAAGTGAAVAGVLASREVLHTLLKRMSWTELRSVLLLAAMTAIVLPLLPRRTIDPWGGFNPWEVWFFTVLTAALSYLGYVATRLFGPRRGLILSSAAGAVVSSTSVTLAISRMAKSADSPRVLAGAALLAAAISVARVCLIVCLVQPSVVPGMAPGALAALVGFGGSAGFLLANRAEAIGAGPTPRNPFDLGPLLLFAVIFAVVATFNAALASHVGSKGLILSTAFSAAVDVDVATISVLRLVGVQTDTLTAGQAVLGALLVNGLLRLGIALAFGPPKFRILVLTGNAAALAFAGLVYRAGLTT